MPSFYLVKHGFNEAVTAQAWWKGVMELLSDEKANAAFEKRARDLGYVNHQFLPIGDGQTDIYCLWEQKSGGVEEMQAFIDSDASTAQGLTNTVMGPIHPQANFGGCTPQFIDLSDTTFTAFVPATAPDSKLPVMLFQSGYGSSSIGHAPLLQKIADAGMCVVVPDRKGDSEGGANSVMTLFTKGICLSAMSSDGKHLAAALDWVKANPEVKGCALDTTQIVSAGFSMGCVEALNFSAACDEVSATVIISSSTSPMVEPMYQFKEADMLDKASKFSHPALYITSEKDCQREATKLLYTNAASPASYVEFKDSVIDNSMDLTSETSIWAKEHKSLVPGLAQHFAVAAERGVVSDTPIISFLQTSGILGGSSALAAEADVVEAVSK